MSDTNFIPQVTTIVNTWAQDVNDAVYRAIGTGGGGSAPATPADVLTNLGLSPPTGSALIGYTNGATGSIPRTVASKLQESVSVFDFLTAAQIADVQSGALTLDLTTEINSAVVAAAGKQLNFPAGSYLYSGGATLGTGTVISGDGRNTTLIYSAVAAPSSLFNAAGYGSGLQHIGFKAHVTQTGGNYVTLGSAETYITDFTMDGDFNGIYMSGSVSRIRHGRFQDGAANATRIIATGGDNSQVIDDVLMGAQTPQIVYAGIRVFNNFALMITNTSVLQQGTALLINPSSSAENVGSMYVDNCFFDYSSGPNIHINPTGTGSVVRSRFANVWAGDGAADGVSIVNAGTGVISGIHFVSPHIMNNVGAGLTTGGTITDLSIIGGEISQNAYGVYLNSGITGLNISSALIGAGGGMNGNTNQAIVLSAGVNTILISGNDLTGNGASPPISDGTAAGTTKIISNNLGYNPIAATPVTYGTSPFTWQNNTGAPVSFITTGGTVSDISVAGVSTGMTSGAVTVPQGESITIPATAAPTLTYLGL